MKLLLKAPILSNYKVAPEHYKLILSAPQITQIAQPGQFIHIKWANYYSPLLRRPFSIHAINKIIGELQILYRIRGIGTQIMKSLPPGTTLDVIGPLGNGFTINQSNQKAIIIAGGCGVAPFPILAENLPIKPLVLIGAKTKNLILCEEEFKTLGCQLEASTEDGSAGFKGLVTELLEGILTQQLKTKKQPQLYAAGPKPMLKQVAQLAQHYQLPCQVSLEQNLGCGIGACLSCVVKTKSGYQRVCSDGPIFNSSEVIWDEY